MKVGDLVNYYDGLPEDKRVGLVMEIIHWKDEGAPDRNFGIDVTVFWTNGERGLYAPEELVLVE